VTLEAALLAAVSALAACIVVLYFRQNRDYDACLDRERECEQKHDRLLERVVAIETERRVRSDLERRVAELFTPMLDKNEPRKP
jgi:hypothetical protein